MTKEELEKEAEEWLCNNLHSASEEDFIKAMVDIAEPREKRIEELEAQCGKMKKYLDCDFCEYQNNKDECHQCNYLEKTRWTLKKEIKE